MCQRYPQIRHRADDPSRPVFNNLFIDTNPVIYRAISTSKITDSLPTPEFLAEFFRYLDMIVQVVEPTDLIFIGADGPAPAAKARQQRANRYAHSRGYMPGQFDRCSVTPGTEFMQALDEEIVKFITRQRAKDLTWSRATVLYSSAFVPGEGEHKFMNYIREKRATGEWDRNQVHCFYANDADLMFLILQTHEPYACNVREIDAVAFQRDRMAFEGKMSSMNWGREAFELVHFSLLRQYLQHDFGVDSSSLERVLDDFVAMSFLVGNDFIPDFPDIDIKKGAMSEIMGVYKALRKDDQSKYLVSNGEFNKPFLIEFLSGVCDFYRARNAEKKGITGEADELKKIYRERNEEYLKSKYPERCESDFDGLVREMSQEIIYAFNWVLKYYACGCPSWTWFYKFHYAPPLEFVIPYINQVDPVFEVGEPVLPLVQLLAVSPPTSAHLLPKPLQYLLEEGSPIADLYPTEFKTDKNERVSDYQAVILIPMPDFDRVKAEFDKHVDELTEEEEDRNYHQKTKKFDAGLEYELFEFGQGTIFEPVDLSDRVPPGVPFFQHMPIRFEERTVPVEIFERPYNHDSLVVCLEEEGYSKVEEAKGLIGKEILIGWPYMRPAKVIGAMDHANLLKENLTMAARPNAVEFPAEKVRDQALRKTGLEMGEIKVFLRVKVQNRDGTYKNEPEFCPVQLYMPIDGADTKVLFEPGPPRELEEGEPLVFATGMAAGFTGKLLKRNANKSLDVQVLQMTQPPGITTLIGNDRRNWVGADVFVKSIGGISFKALRHAMTSVIISPQNVNIAFALYSMHHQVVEGVCKHIGKDKVFADWLVPLMKEWFAKTGNLKQLIMEAVNRGETRLPPFSLAELYGGNEQTQKERFAELVEWMTENAPASKYCLVSDSSDFVSATCLHELESKVRNFKPTIAPREIEDMPEECTLWRAKPYPGSDAMPSLGQRVISIAPAGAATFGEIGTVIGIDAEEKIVSVLFDNDLPCGTTLEGRLFTPRGLRLHLQDIYIIGGAQKPARTGR